MDTDTYPCTPIYTDIQVSQRSLVCSLPGIPQRQLAVETSEGYGGSVPSPASSSASASISARYFIRAQVRVIVADQISARHSGAELTFGNVPALHICDNAGLSPVHEMQGWGGVAGGAGGGGGGLGVTGLGSAGIWIVLVLLSGTQAPKGGLMTLVQEPGPRG